MAFRAEEVLLEVDFAGLVERWLLCIQRADAEHLTGPLRIARCDDRRVEVVIALLIEVLVDAEAHLVPHAEDRAVGVGSEAQVCVLAEEFQRMLLRLDRVLVRRAITEHLHGRHLHFHALAAALRRDKLSGALYGRAGGEACARFRVHFLLIDHALQVADGAAVVERDEAVVAKGAHPAGHGDGGVGE